MRSRNAAHVSVVCVRLCVVYTARASHNYRPFHNWSKDIWKIESSPDFWWWCECNSQRRSISDRYAPHWPLAYEASESHAVHSDAYGYFRLRKLFEKFSFTFRSLLHGIRITFNCGNSFFDPCLHIDAVLLPLHGRACKSLLLDPNAYAAMWIECVCACAIWTSVRLN